MDSILLESIGIENLEEQDKHLEAMLEASKVDSQGGKVVHSGSKGILVKGHLNAFFFKKNLFIF